MLKRDDLNHLEMGLWFHSWEKILFSLQAKPLTKLDVTSKTLHVNALWKQETSLQENRDLTKDQNLCRVPLQPETDSYLSQQPHATSTLTNPEWLGQSVGQKEDGSNRT